VTPRENRIWLAALLEGEGWFSLKQPQGGRRASISVGIKMTDADVVQRAACLMKGVAKLREDNRSERFNACWECVVSGAKAEKVMKDILPFMGARRRAKIVELLATESLSHRKQV
jgi:hypothetical protein